MNFYSYKYGEVMQLTNAFFIEMFVAMKKIKARDRLRDFDNLSFTKMIEDRRSKLHRQVYDEAQTEESIELSIMRTEAEFGDFGVIKEGHGRRQ